jgi:signal transduction histidine kinase/CheY-like chemotaxis protein
MSKQKPFKLHSTFYIAGGNLLLIAGMVVSLYFYTQMYHDSIRKQNLDDIGNITESSATVASNFFTNEKTRLNDNIAYIEHCGFTYDQALEHLHYSKSNTKAICEIIGANKKGKAASFDANGKYQSLSYTDSSYDSFSTIFNPSAADLAATGNLRGSLEFTDGYTALSSFAIYGYLPLSDGTSTATYTLMIVHESSEFSSFFSGGASYPSIKGTLINSNGDYLIGTASFKGENLFKYFYSFNGLTMAQRNADQEAFSSGKQNVYYYKDATGVDCVFVIRQIQIPEVSWYVVSAVPLSSYHNYASSAWIISTMSALLLLMMGFNFAWMKRANRKLREAAEREKEAAATEKEASDAKSVFFSRMSHDIRTPLNVVIGSATLALKEPNSPTTQKYLSDINQSGKFLLSLVNDLLDLNKVQNGKMVLHPAPYSLKEFAESMSSIVTPLCLEKNLSFTLSGFDDTTPYLVDAMRLKEIAFNLLSNSVKFTPSGGKISLRAVWGAEQNGKRTLLLSESDNGIGMSEEFQKTMFDPFSQEEKNQTLAMSGTGLGLSIVKSLVALMGGEITVRSAPNVGTTFTVSLPMEKSNGAFEKEASSSQEDLSILRGKKILLCEDNPLNSKIAKALLENQGMLVEVAVNGKAGLDRFVNAMPHTYDLILMDMRMPVMDGLESAKAIRASRKNDAKTIPIVAMTANAYDEDIDACLQAGMNSHLAKPVDPPLMYKEIAKQLRLAKSKKA